MSEYYSFKKVQYGCHGKNWLVSNRSEVRSEINSTRKKILETNNSKLNSYDIQYTYVRQVYIRIRIDQLSASSGSDL